MSRKKFIPSIKIRFELSRKKIYSKTRLMRHAMREKFSLGIDSLSDYTKQKTENSQREMKINVG